MEWRKYEDWLISDSKLGVGGGLMDPKWAMMIPRRPVFIRRHFNATFISYFPLSSS
jgi:hypothetical protein